MWVKISLLVGLVCLLCSAQLASAQKKLAWLSQIEQILEKGEWRTVAKRVYVQKGSKKVLSMTIQLTHGEENATIDINLKPSPKEAREELRGMLTFPGAKPEVTTINRFCCKD